MTSQLLRRLCVVLISSSLLLPFIAPAAQAAMVTTDQAMALENRTVYLDSAGAALARQEVREGLIAMGVDPAAVDGRLAALTNAELQALAGRLEEAPAGGTSVLAIIGVVFLVLLVLEYTGTIDIFKKVP